MKYLAWMGNGGAEEGAPGVEQQVTHQCLQLISDIVRHACTVCCEQLKATLAMT